MHQQNQIKRTLAQPEAINIVRSQLASNVHRNRASLSRALCQHFNFHDARRQHQIGGFNKALQELERAGHFIGPTSSTPKSIKSPRRVALAVPDPVDVPEVVGAVQGLRLIKVDSVDLMRICNEMMLREYPQGAGPLVGCQLRYLIDSEHGWLGGFAFSAAALKLRERDQWIGWDTDQHRRHLQRILGMSRFLLRTSVHCHNLASTVLGMVLRQVGTDFETQYGYRPWLVESFVDTEQFLGTCYKATNWSAIGQTQDRPQKAAKSVKTIYVYAIEPQWRAKMDLLVRAKYDDDAGGHLFESVRASPACGEMVIKVPGQSQLTKKSKQQAKPGHVQRNATVAVRYQDIELRPGAYQKRQSADQADRGACSGDDSAQR